MPEGGFRVLGKINLLDTIKRDLTAFCANELFFGWDS